MQNESLLISPCRKNMKAVMNDNIYCDRSRLILNEYAETVSIAKFLLEGQSTRLLFLKFMFDIF